MGITLHCAVMTLVLSLCTRTHARILNVTVHSRVQMRGGTCRRLHRYETALQGTWMETVFRPEPDKMLNQLATIYKDNGTWLQIGANTLDPRQNSNDPFMRHLNKFPGWQKIFVEPIPQLFASLEQTVKKWPNSSAINVALSSSNLVAEERVPMYCLEGATTALSPKDLPSWANQICSFDPKHVSKHFPKGKTQEVQVNAVSFQHLISKYNIKDIRVLMIDTEGFDYNVLQQVPFRTMKPLLVLWEHKHMKMEDRAAALELMRSHCYGVWQADGDNSIALRLT